VDANEAAAQNNEKETGHFFDKALYKKEFGPLTVV
jgi:hypothetical protein